MFPTIIDRIHHHIDNWTKSYYAPQLRAKLVNDDFSIISNNCWGGVCYEHYGLQKLSPTVGMYFYPEDFLKLISDIDYYFSMELEVITSRDSKRLDILRKDHSDQFYLGVLGDIEAVLVHYKDPQIAKEKWKRRVSRINRNNLVFKFSQQNGCLDQHLQQFATIELPGKKFMFVKDSTYLYDCAVHYRGFEKCEEIMNDTFYWNRYFDVTRFLNGDGIIKKQ